MELLEIIRLIDLTGVAVFAATGGLVASRKELDVIGFVLIATITGIGGGTLRDLLLGQPVFWIQDQSYLYVCFAVAIFVFFFAHRLQRRYVALVWGDAVGLVVFAVMGAHIASRSGATPFLAVLFGVMTATFGGLIRDIVAGETPLALKPEIYVSAALISSGAFVLLRYLELPIYVAVAISLVLGFLVRAGAIYKGWVLPRYKNRAGRDYT